MYLVIVEALSTVCGPVHVADLLQHSIAIRAHLLIHDLAAVYVVLDELFDSSKLYMLVHEFGSSREHLAYVLLQCGVLISGLLEMQVSDRPILLM